VFPEIAELVGSTLQAQILPSVVKRLRRCVEIENGDVRAIAGFRSGYPNSSLVGRDGGMAASGVLIDTDQLCIGERGFSPLVRQSEIAAHDERRAKDGPEGEESALLVVIGSMSASGQ